MVWSGVVCFFLLCAWENRYVPGPVISELNLNPSVPSAKSLVLETLNPLIEALGCPSACSRFRRRSSGTYHPGANAQGWSSHGYGQDPPGTVPRVSSPCPLDLDYNVVAAHPPPSRGESLTECALIRWPPFAVRQPTWSTVDLCHYHLDLFLWRSWDTPRAHSTKT